MFQRAVVEKNHNKYFRFTQFFPDSRTVYEITWKNYE